jgi:hypothetical protein
MHICVGQMYSHDKAGGSPTHSSSIRVHFHPIFCHASYHFCCYRHVLRTRSWSRGRKRAKSCAVGKYGATTCNLTSDKATVEAIGLDLGLAGGKSVADFFSGESGETKSTDLSLALVVNGKCGGRFRVNTRLKAPNSTTALTELADIHWSRGENLPHVKHNK